MLGISERTVDGVTIMDLNGKIMRCDGDDTLRDAFALALDRGAEKIALNLANVPYVDGEGLGELVRCHTSASKKGAMLKFFGLTKKIVNLLLVTKLLAALDIYETEEEALASFRA